MTKIRSGSKKHKQRNDTSSKAQFNNKPKRVAKAAVKGEYKGIAYDSLEELAFLQWASELQRDGYIRSIERSESFLLCDAMTIGYAEQLKTKSKPMQQTILHGHSYTPEFRIIWNKKAYDHIIADYHQPKKVDKLLIGQRVNHIEQGALETYIEIKPMWDQNNMERLFRVNQKWMWQRHNIFVNLVKCPELFARSFTPNEYLTTKSGKNRLIKWKIKKMYDFLK